MTLDEFVDLHYWDYCRKLRQSTVVGYRSAYANHVSPMFGGWELDTIKARDIEIWLAGFELAGAAEKAYTTLRGMLRKAERWDMIGTDPTRREIDRPHKHRYIPPVLSAQGVRDLLRGFFAHELEACVICSVCLGLRRGEACGLMWSDIDLRSGEVRISRSRQYVGGQVVVLAPKTDRSERTCYLPRFAVARLREVRGAGWLSGDLTPDAVSRRYKAHCRRAGLPYVPLTNLRHTWATTSLAAGNDVAVVSKMLGHSDIVTTARYYLVPDRKLMQAAQRTWEAAILK